jgi:DNA topoisomerase IA
MKQQL